MFENLNLETKDWLTIGALILGPILAIQVQKVIEALQEKRRRRLNLFTTLMSTRGERVSRNHVQALNMIDIEFYGRVFLSTRFQTPSEKSVTNAWKNYNDHLNSKGSYNVLADWAKDGNTLFIKLLYEMSKSLGYDYDEVQLKRDCYRPEAHANIESAQQDVLNGLAKVLKNESSLQVAVTAVPNQHSHAGEE